MTATGSQLVRTDDYEASIEAVDDARRDLERQRRESEAARENYAILQERAEAEVIELQRLEEERKADAEVQHALERQRQERLEQERLERERQEREAAQQAAAADTQLPYR